RADNEKEWGEDTPPPKVARLSLSGQVDLQIGQVGRHFHRPALLTHGGDSSLGIGLRYSDEPIWLGVRKGPDERAIDEAEHGGVAADPQRERKRRYGSEAGMLAQHPKAVAQVLPQISEHLHSPCSKNYGFMIDLALDAPQFSHQ